MRDWGVRGVGLRKEARITERWTTNGNRDVNVQGYLGSNGLRGEFALLY